MASKSYAIDLPAPLRSRLELDRLTRALYAPAARDLLTRLLSDTRDQWGLLEHPSEDFSTTASVNVETELTHLRTAGWVQQRRGAHGLLTRLRRDDLDDRCPGLLDHLMARLTNRLPDRLGRENDERRRLNSELWLLTHLPPRER